MVSVRQAVQALESLYPLRYAEDWDEPGLIVGDLDEPVRHIVCAADPTWDVVQSAIASHADLLVCHHPLYFRAVHTVSSQTVRGAIVSELYRHGCALWVGHTNADAALRGVAQAAADAFGMVDQHPLVPISDAERPDDEVGLGRVGVLSEPVTLHDFAHRVASELPKTHLGVQVSGDLDGMVRSIAVLPGAGDSLFDEVCAADVDVYVTSDLRHHPATDAMEQARHEARMRMAAELDRGLSAHESADNMHDGPTPIQVKPALINTPHSAIESIWFRYAVEDIPQAIAKITGEQVDVQWLNINTDPWNLSIVTA